MNKYNELKNTSFFSEEYQVYFEDNSYHSTYINLVSVDPFLPNEQYRFLISIPQLKASFFLPLNPSKESISLKIQELEEPVYPQFAENLWNTIVTVKNKFIHHKN